MCRARFVGLFVALLGGSALLPAARGQRADPGIEGLWALVAPKDRDGKPVASFPVRDFPPRRLAPSREQATEARKRMTAFLGRRGIRDGMLTKGLFRDFLRSVRAEQTAWKRFPQLDLDGDGMASRLEAQKDALRKRSSKLLDVFDRYDTNRNGFLEPGEYATYLEDRSLSPPEPAPADDKPQPAQPEAPRPVYRYGKLPVGLPGWFTELDTDKDGQVALYEWLVADKPLAEFRKYDLDRDGLIVTEELLRAARTEERDGGAAKGAPKPSP